MPSGLCRQHFKSLSHIWSGEFFYTAVGESHIAGKPSGLCWLELCQSPGEESGEEDKTSFPYSSGRAPVTAAMHTPCFSGEEWRMCLRMVVSDRQPRAGARRIQPHSQPGSRGGHSSQGTKLLLSHHAGEEAILVSSHTTSVGDFLTGELAATSSSPWTSLPLPLTVLTFLLNNSLAEIPGSCCNYLPKPFRCSFPACWICEVKPVPACIHPSASHPEVWPYR